MDDERGIIEVYRDVLTLRNHDVIAEAFDGEEAIETYKNMQKKPDVIIMDHRMPNKNGIDAMNDIRSLDPMQCIIFVTADFQAAKNSLSMGANSFILKPFRMDVLFNAIETVLLEREDKKSKLREKLLGIVAQYGASPNKELKNLCDSINKNVINEYLGKQHKDSVDVERTSIWACEFMNLMGFDFEYHLKEEKTVVIKNTKCRWREKFGENPIFCSVTKCILARFAMRAGRDVKFDIRSTLMNRDKCCLFEVKA